MAVGTGNIKLSQVITEIGSGSSLQDCFDNAFASGFDPIYEENKNSLLDFRGYNHAAVPPTITLSVNNIVTGVYVNTNPSLSWIVSSETDVTGYNVYRNGVSVGSNVQVKTWTDTSPVTCTQVAYTVKAIYRATETTASNTQNVKYDAVAPTVPVITEGTVTATSIQINWSATTDTCSGTDSYVVAVERVGSGEGYNLLYFPTLPTYTFTALEGVNYNFKVLSKDVAGNSSVYSNILNITAEDPNTAPTWGASPLNPISDNVTSLGISWDAANDDNGISYYEVHREVNDSGIWNLIVTTPDGTTLAALDLSFSNGNKYNYRIKGFDAAGLDTGWSNEEFIQL